MRKKILTVSLVLVMALSFSACAKGAESPLAQEIANGVIESLANVRTYQFDTDMTIDMAGEAEGEAFEATMVIASSGALDLENSRMRTDMTMDMVMTGEDEIEMGMEMYLIGDMMYMMIDAPEVNPMWMKSKMPEGTWEEVSQVESQIELLEAAQVEVTGSETIGGIDCYVLQITTLDMKQLWELVMKQTEAAGGGMPPVAEEFLQEMFRSFSIKQWVAKDTYFLTKAEVDMVVELTPEAMGLEEEAGDVTMDITTDFLAYDYNQPVSIVLPPEAEEALEVGR